MDGFQISFYTSQDRRHDGKPMGEWLLGLAAELGFHGASLRSGGEGFGRDGRMHSAHFFELSDQPVEVLFVVTSEQSTRLFERLKAEKAELFYVKTQVEFGDLGVDG